MSATTIEMGNGGRCFHPGDDGAPAASVSPCFHPGDGDGEPIAHRPEPVSPCFHPDDHRVCFHPGGDAAESGSSVSSCPHPADDLATDLHLSLTGLDERELAALAGNRA
jgi:hypothetical protein